MIEHFPKCDVNTIMKYCRKEWSMMYNGSTKRKQFDRLGWKNFVEDNELQVDDGCIFEVMESNDETVRIKVVIMRNTAELPPELANLGEDFENVIKLD